jgi:glycosyltransferase involved in cell wall biosynthesis
MSKIFVSIAAYRDPELLPTLANLIENAANPDDLVICIAWQHSKQDKWDTLKKYKKDPRFKIIDIPYEESEGVCWARAKIQEQYQGEDYYFQLDSHHRFIKNWDAELIDMVHYLQCKGYLKPLISAYIPSYFPDKDPKDRVDEVWMLNIQRFLPEGAVFLNPQGLDGWKDMIEPVPARFLSAHFIFTLGKFADEVPYDPNFYFHGEETSLAARAYTHGYDLFSPHKIYAWHEYFRDGKTKQWDDDSIWPQRDKNSYARFRSLFGMDEDCISCVQKEFGKHGFGNKRSLSDYERYAGLKFKTRQIHEYTLTNNPPPTKGDYESGLRNKIKVCIDVYKGSITESDYSMFAVALLDKNGNDLYRQDADGSEIKYLMNVDPNDQFIHIWREFENTTLPSSWRVWPHSESKGWMDVIEQTIKYE